MALFESRLKSINPERWRRDELLATLGEGGGGNRKKETITMHHKM
jgi:hypothetical protein